MAPKAVSLAYAGRKLTGPPEGYGAKKELQVKRWISGVPPPDECEQAEVASVTTLTELGESRENLYRSLRDSTDGYGPVQPMRPPDPAGRRPGATAGLQRPGTQGQLPPQQTQPRPTTAVSGAFSSVSAEPVVVDAVCGSGPGPGPSAAARPPTPPQQQQQHTSDTSLGQPANPMAPGPNSLQPQSTRPASPQGVGPGTEAGASRHPGSPLASPSASRHPSAHTSASAARDHLSIVSPPALAPAIVATTASGSGVRPTPGRADGAAGLGGLSDLFASGGGDAAWGQAAHVGGGEDDVELAMEIVLARVEATLPQGASAEEKYRRALALVVEEQQRFQGQVRSELAAARALAAEARGEAQARAADLQVAACRAKEAEEELGRVRAQALTYKQQAQRLQIEAEEGVEARDEQLTRAQAELAAAVAQLKEQSARANRAVEAASAESAAARSEVTSLQQQLALVRRHHEQDVLKMEARTVSLQAALDLERNAAAAAKAERDRLEAALQAESAARKAAEGSERQALRAAASQAKTQEALQATAAAAEAARQRVATAAQRATAVRAADPAAAVLDQSATAAAAVDARGSSGAEAGRGGIVPRAEAGGPHRNAARRNTRDAAGGTAAVPPSPQSAPGAPAPGSPGNGGPSPAGAPGTAAAAAGPGTVEASRATGHRALRRGLAADRQQLGDLAVARRRAAAAAELADARVVEAALAAAPEHLRALGLAFRAYIVGAGPQQQQQQQGAPQQGRGGAAGGARAGAGATAAGTLPAAALASQLSGAGYRVYVDPLTVQPSPAPLYEVPSAPLVGLSAAVVVLAAPGLLRKPLARGELCSAVGHGCPLVVLSPPGLSFEALSEGEEPALTAAAGEAEQQLELASEALREAWPSRLPLPDNLLAGGSPPTALTARLGLTDPQLALLPLDALRPLAIPRTRVMPDLVHLNAVPLPSPLQAGAAAGAAGDGAGTGPGVKAVGGGCVSAPGLGGLMHLKLTFGQGQGGGGGGGGGALVEVLCAVLRGNTTLTALSLRGCPATAARTITEAVLSSPVSRVSLITVASCPVPVAHLAGRPAAPGSTPPPPVIHMGAPLPSPGDSSAAGAAAASAPGAGRTGAGGGGRGDDTPFTDEDAEVVAAALRARARAVATAEAGAGAGNASLHPPPPPLLSLSLPGSCNRGLSGGGVRVLVEALSGLQGLQAVNGVGLEATAAAALPPSPPRPGTGGTGGGGGAGSGRGLLDLSGSRCGPVVLALLARRLQSSLASLPALNLTGCEVGPVGAACLADSTAPSGAAGAAASGSGSKGAIQSGSGSGWLGALHTACLADNCLGPEGVERILSAMACPGTPPAAAAGAPSFSCVRVLDLSLNHLGDAGCKALSKALPALGPSLRVLALSHNGIGTEGVRALAGALAACGGLRELLLAGNQLGDQAARELAGALQRLTGLQVLQLQDNPRLAGDGVGGLAAALASLPSLEELNLARCHCGDEGARHLAKALPTCPALASLTLEGCKIRTEGAARIAAALAHAPPSTTTSPPSRLSHLNLARNPLGDRGAAALAEALRRNQGLTSLDLRGAGVGLAGCRALEGALRERNASLRVLALAGNEMDEEDLRALEALAASQRRVARPLHQALAADTAGPSASPAKQLRSRSTAQTAAAVHAAVPRKQPQQQQPQVQQQQPLSTHRSVPGVVGTGGRASASHDSPPAMAPHYSDPAAAVAALEAVIFGYGAGGGAGGGSSLAGGGLSGGVDTSPARTGPLSTASGVGSGAGIGAGAAGRSPGRQHLEAVLGGGEEEEGMDEELEELLRRYRTGLPGGGGAAGGLSVLRAAEEGGSLLDLGYTGMRG